MTCKEAPLTSAGVVHTGMRTVGQCLLDALAEEDRLYQEDLGDKGFKRWKASRKLAEQLAVDYAAMLRLYLEAVAIGMAFPEYSN
jgi:hypothetical protein